MEAPGPKAVDTGFVSRNNPDPTARNLCCLLSEPAIPRSWTALWNVIPWYVGEGGRIRRAKQSDLIAARSPLAEALSIFESLRCVVLLGKAAGRCESMISAATPSRVLKTWHPSARVFNVWKEAICDVKRTLQEAREMAER